LSILGDTLDLLHIITGVAIGETGDKTSVFFGCYPKWPGLGGAGLIRLYRKWSKKRIFPLKVNDQRLIAGSVMVVKDMTSQCPQEDYKPEVCTELPVEHTKEIEPEPEPEVNVADQTKDQNEAPYDVISENNNDVITETEDEVVVKRDPEINVINSDDVEIESRERKSSGFTVKMASVEINMLMIIMAVWGA